MKKIIIALCLLLIALQLTGCGEPTVPACEHDYVSTVTKEATYEEEGVKTYTCSKCDSTYTEAIEKLEKPVISVSVLNSAVSNAQYRNGPFSISVAKLVNSAIPNYKMKHYSGEEAIEKGYMNKSQIDSTIDLDYLYCSVISGDTKVNPDIPYLTEYEDVAIKVWTLYDQNGELDNYGIELCDNLQTYAILIMTSSY